ncbi:MAG TPA: T9SS type A sorting domain-containing protein [Bacteroidia bacterium]|jgi:hypothetical protein|nr:T9SS type A sorting domain-containing protein [Bacteroidia bacterium]
MRKFILSFLLLAAVQVYGQTPISRAQIISNAVPFTTYTFHAGTSNIWNNTACSGIGNILTPSWVSTSASNTSMAYCWGGFSTTSSFTTGLTKGKSAGDRDCTTSGDGSESCSLGVDCSGFVSHCWSLTTKYSTSTLPNISTAYSSASLVQQGDIFNYAGSHVRLVETNYYNGTFRVIESSANGWDVAYHSYTASQLTSYVPRWYVHVATVTGINTVENVGKQVSVSMSPNPFRDQLTVNVQSLSATLGACRLEFYDENGRKVLDSELPVSDHREISTSIHTMLGSGIYFYRILNEGNPVYNGKVVVN